MGRNGRGQRLVTHHMHHQTPDLGWAQASQRESSEVSRHGPRGVKLETRRQDETEASLGALVNEQAQQLQSGGIDPVQVLHYEQDRLPLRYRMQPGQKGLQRFLALPLRRQSERGIGVW